MAGLVRVYHKPSRRCIVARHQLDPRIPQPIALIRLARGRRTRSERVETAQDCITGAAQFGSPQRRYAPRRGDSAQRLNQIRALARLARTPLGRIVPDIPCIPGSLRGGGRRCYGDDRSIGMATGVECGGSNRGLNDD